MEFLEVPAALGLSNAEWTLLLDFFTFREEPLARLPHLCQMEPADLDGALERLVNLDLIVPKDRDGQPWYALAPLERWLDGLDGADADALAQERAQLRRLRSLLGLPSVTVVANREIQDRQTLHPEILRYAHALMPNVDLRLGTRCNLNCEYCLLGHEDRYDRSAAEVAADLAFAREQNLEKVAFTGGEPTMHPDLLRLVSVARRMGFREQILVTNGTTLPYPGRLDRLVEAGISAVGISFDSPDRETAETMWRSPVFDRVVAAFDQVARFPTLNLGSIAVVTARNFRQLPDLARFFVDLDGRIGNLFVPNLDFVMPEENAWLNRAVVVPRLSDVAPHVTEALRIAHGHGLPLTFRGFPPCILPGLERYAYDRYMTIFRLVRTADGPVFDRMSLDVLRTKAPGCRRCVHYRECTGVSRSYANLHGTDELRPVEAA